MVEPKVRFKQDDGSEFPALNKVLLGDITVPVSVRNGDNNSFPVYSVNNQKGFIPQSDQFEEREVASQDRSNYRVVCRNQFAYNPSRINVGSVAYLKDDLKVIVSPLYVVFSCKDVIKNEYLNEYVRTNSFHNKRKRNTEGSVRDSLSYEGFASIDVMLPCIDEQQKIVDFLSSVDVVISTSEQEVANLEMQKMAVMKKIFSQEVRFKKTDGTVFPEWEEKLLSDVSECLDNQRVPINATE